MSSREENRNSGKLFLERMMKNKEIIFIHRALDKKEYLVIIRDNFH